MSDKRDLLEYVLNRMESERDKPPPTVGYPGARKELLDGIAALRSRAEAAEAQLCRARDYLLTIKSSMENVAGAFLGYVDVDAMINGLNEYAPCPHEAILCRVKKEWDDTIYSDADVDSALSSSSPCPHAAEAKLFRERYELEQIRYEGISAANEELREEAKRMREAVDWACSSESYPLTVAEIRAELRRRAGGEG